VRGRRDPLLAGSARAVGVKVYIVEVGAYSDRFIDAVFASRELAEAYIVERARRRWDGKEWNGSGYTPVPFPERGGLSFEEWTKRVDPGDWNVHGHVEEYEVWDSVPIAESAAKDPE
jgi:hypothetical protein